MAGVSPHGVRLCAGAALALAWLFGMAASSPAQTQPTVRSKAPEDWTIEERLEARFDPVAMKARREAHAKDVGPPFEDLPDDPDECFVDGSKNPELYLPWEMFTYLLTRAFSSNPEHNQLFRESLAAEAEALGIGRRLWPTLEAIIPEILHVRALAKENGQKLLAATGVSRRSFEAEDEALGKRACALRRDALQTARGALGEKTFDRFLYRAVAPWMMTGMRFSEWREQLRFVEEGCQ